MTWRKWGSKQALEKRKTSLSLMEVFNIALKCSLQERIRRLVRSMTMRVTELHNKRGGYTRY
jgi:spore coat protein CotF